ncbi:acetyltransferase [Rhodopseudomonas palustris]
MRDLLLVGGGGHCKAVIDVVEKTAEWRIVGIVDSHQELADVLGYPVIGTDDDLPKLARGIGHALITVGQIKTSNVRYVIYRKLKDAGFLLASVVSPLAEVSSRAQLGEGTIVMHFACIGPDARIGHNTIINTRALVEHDCKVGHHCHISTGAILNGGVEVGDGTLIGSRTVIREGLAIGAGCVVSMGSSVRRSVPPDTTYIEGKPNA